MALGNALGAFLGRTGGIGGRRMVGASRGEENMSTDAVEWFCWEQAALRARLALAGRPEGASAPGDARNGVTDDPGGMQDGQG